MKDSVFSRKESSVKVGSSISLPGSDSKEVASFSSKVTNISSFFTFLNINFTNTSTFASSFTISFIFITNYSSILTIAFLLPNLHPLFLNIFSSTLISTATSIYNIATAKTISFAISTTTTTNYKMLTSDFYTLSLITM